MNNDMTSEELMEFLNDPDTVDFVFRTNEFVILDIENIPLFRFTRVLSDRYVIAYASRNDIDEIRDLLGTNYFFSRSIVLGLLDREALEASGIRQVQEQSFLSLTGRGVLIGLIDTGIDYTNPAFIYEDGTTKIVSIYDMGDTTGPSPEGFYLGTEYTRDQINEALRSDDPYSIVRQRDTSGHGTFLASIMASREPGEYIGAAPDAEIVAVKLKRARPFYLEYYMIPEDQENAFESSAVMLGVEYVLEQARRLNRPVAICLGIGTNQSTHDGYSIIEQYLEQIATISGVCVCTAVGNESQARHHMRGNISETGAIATIDINCNELGSNIFTNIISPVSDRISVSIQSPSGEVVGRVPAKSGTLLTTSLIFEKSRISVEYYYPVTGSSGQITIVKIQGATPGIWSIRVHGDIITNGRFDAYLPLTGLGSPGVEFLAPDPYYTTVVPSTAISTITVGAYNSIENSLYVNSSWGPTLLPLNAPDLVAPGVMVGGIYPTGTGTMTGTSVAAAITTGASALMLQWGIIEGNNLAISTYQIKGYFIRGCERSEFETYPNFQWGYGKLDLFNSFNLMREL
jgi:subtilisin family serine protease